MSLVDVECRRGMLVILWMSLVDVAVGVLVACMSFVLWVCLRETFLGGFGGWGILCGPREVNAAFYYEFGL